MDINDITQQIKDLQKLKQKMSETDVLTDGATKMYDMFRCFVKAGFTEQQAWKLITIIVSNSYKQ